MESKKLFFAFIAVLLLLSGCNQPERQSTPTPTQTPTVPPVEEAIKISDESDFGKVIAWNSSLLERAKKCDFEKYASIAEKMSGSIVPGKQKSELEPYFRKAMSCVPSFEKKAVLASEGKYKVSYYLVASKDCPSEELKKQFVQSGSLKDFDGKVVEVDLNSRNAVLPAMPESAVSLASNWKEYNLQLEKQMKTSKDWFMKTYNLSETEFESLMDCAMPAGFAMFLYVLDLQSEIGVDEITCNSMNYDFSVKDEKLSAGADRVSITLINGTGKEISVNSAVGAGDFSGTGTIEGSPVQANETFTISGINAPKAGSIFGNGKITVSFSYEGLTEDFNVLCSGRIAREANNSG
ncbi:MAG: hypothetical protein QXK06_05215 [Candidatus Diapherotrites archaeon]